MPEKANCHVGCATGSIPLALWSPGLGTDGRKKPACVGTEFHSKQGNPKGAWRRGKKVERGTDQPLDWNSVRSSRGPTQANTRQDGKEKGLIRQQLSQTLDGRDGVDEPGNNMSVSRGGGVVVETGRSRAQLSLLANSA